MKEFLFILCLILFLGQGGESVSNGEIAETEIMEQESVSQEPEYIEYYEQVLTFVKMNYESNPNFIPEALDKYLSDALINDTLIEDLSEIEDVEKECLNYAERWWIFYYGLWDNQYIEHYFPMDFCEYISQAVEQGKVEEALSNLSLGYYLPDMEGKKQIVNDSGWGYFSAYYYANRESLDNADWYCADVMSVNDILIEEINENGQKSYIFFNHVTGEGKADDPGYNLPVVEEGILYMIWKMKIP